MERVNGIEPSFVRFVETYEKVVDTFLAKPLFVV
jgi:hypothetical protein